MKHDVQLHRPIRKPFYRIDEICARWSLMHTDIAAFALGGELQVSVAVARLPVELGTWEHTPDGERFQIPSARRIMSGLVDLLPEDAWRVLEAGAQTVNWLKAAEGEYIEPTLNGASDSGLTVEPKDLAISHAELERFQEVHGLVQPPAISGNIGAVFRSTVSRGATPRFDWDAFWCEVARALLFEGVPESQAALVRRMEGWFAARNQQPDTSTLKKKLSPLWRAVASEAERGHASSPPRRGIGPSEKDRGRRR